MHGVFAIRQDSSTEDKLADAHQPAGDCQAAYFPRIGARRGSHLATSVAVETAIPICVSGIELGPEFLRRVCASMAVSPPADIGAATTPTVAGAALNVANPVWSSSAPG